jgi:hypothetical protein
MINYHGRQFRSRENTENGEVSAETIFEYRQAGELIWANYSGGKIRFGQLIGKINAANEIDLRYQHINFGGDLMTGVCHSTPEILANGQLILHEKWRWTSGDFSEGSSVVEEF